MLLKLPDFTLWLLSYTVLWLCFTFNTIDDKLHLETVKPNKLLGYVDAAYGNNPKKRRSTSGYAFTYSGEAIVYRSKAQSVVALSSTEAELIAAVTTAKTAR